MNKKSYKTKAAVFYTCILKSYMSNDKTFCFINSCGHHMQNIVNKRCVAGGGQCLLKRRYWVQIEAECGVHPFLTVKEG